MDEGYILSNKYRKIIFDEFASGEDNINRIAKKNHIINNVAKKILFDFIKCGIIEKKNNKFHLTKEGNRIAGNLK